MGEPSRRTEVQHIPTTDSVHALAVSGFLSFRLLDEVFRRFDQAFEQRPQVHSLLLDLNDVQSFEPGAPARAVHWLQEHTGRLRSVVVVTNSPVLLATMRAAQVMVPQINIQTAGTRSEGLVLAGRTTRVRTRSNTGLRTAVLPEDTMHEEQEKKSA